MNNFHFLRPEWFVALLPLFLLLYWLVRQQLRSRSWQAVCDPELLPHLLLGRSVRRANWPFWLLSVGLLLAVLALAGPVWKRQPQPLFRQQSALVILFDLSRSMEVADLRPSRFLRARLKIVDLLQQRKEGQTALIVFAADAFTVTPLTEDRHTIEALLNSLDPELMPVQGSNPAWAMQRGEKLLQQAGLKQGRLLLVTDEDRPEKYLDSARQLKKAGFELYVFGVGTPAGAPIPLPGGGFFKDRHGNLVLPKLNGRGLKQLAIAGGGQYRRLSVDDSDLHHLLAGLDDHRLHQAGKRAAAVGERWREEGVWLLWPLLLLAALAFRRGWLLVLPLLLLVPSPAEAFSWSQLWQTQNQQAAQAFIEKDYPAAAQQFQNPRWKASALYRSGDFAGAAKLLKSPQSADDWYNQGNALAKSGDFAAALKAYQQALKLKPGDTDTEFNKNLVEKALQQQQQQQNKKNQQNKPGDKKSQTREQHSKSTDSQNSSDKRDQSPGQQKPSSSKSEQDTDKKGQSDQPAKNDKKSQKGESSKPATAEKEPKKTTKQSADMAQNRAKKSADKKAEKQPDSATASVDKIPETAEQRESRLLLQQIPDDPGGLLRRKFLYQYRQRGQQSEMDRSW
ncbi:MAG: VWA domain-containing protein [Desulfuromusa sp.]